MSDEARAEEDDLLDESDEPESWLREAARTSGPALAKVPLRGAVLGGKYRIEQELGRGGMGAVFRATHIVSGKAFAIKWMLRATSDEQARKRFMREARAAGRIDHPNVVNLYDVCEEGPSSYLVMELLRGESLRKRLRRGILEPAEAVDLLIPALYGVAAAHRAGVIHRDLKPDNIVLCEGPDGSPREAKVLDFGISSIATPDVADSTLTKEGALLGSPSYMSPEQLRSPHDVDVRTDVYALGVILYEATTGTLPFRGDSYSALILAITGSDPKPPSSVRRGISPQFEAVVLRAMARAQTDRYQNIETLIDALRPLRGRPANAVSVRMAPHRARIRRWLVASAILVALGLIGWALLRAVPITAPALVYGSKLPPEPTAQRTPTPQLEHAETATEKQGASAAPTPGLHSTAAEEPQRSLAQPVAEPPTQARAKRSRSPDSHKPAAAPLPSVPVTAEPATNQSGPPRPRAGRLSYEDL